MKSLRQLISEVAQPKSGDEANFKDKHIVDVEDHPVAPETQFSGGKKKAPRRIADYDEFEDEEVYEEFDELDEAQSNYRVTVKGHGGATVKGHHEKHAVSRALTKLKIHKDNHGTYLSGIKKGHVSVVKEEVEDLDEAVYRRGDVIVHKGGMGGKSTHTATVHDVDGQNVTVKSKDGTHYLIPKRSIVKKLDEDLDEAVYNIGDSVSYLSPRTGNSRPAKITKILNKNGETCYKLSTGAVVFPKDIDGGVFDLQTTVGNDDSFADYRDANMNEAMRLDKTNIVYYDSNSEKFAKDYVKGNKGNYVPGGPSAKHEKDAAAFRDLYDTIYGKSGFGGSGHDIYKNKKTGEKFSVTATANGKGFHGTDYRIVKEDVASFITKAAHAKKDSKKRFKLGDKEFPVTVKDSSIEDILDETNENFLSTALKFARRKAMAKSKDSDLQEVNATAAQAKELHRLMLKALGKPRLPKDHLYTSSIASNGDFVVSDSRGKVVGRIKKDDFINPLSEELSENFRAGPMELDDASVVYKKKNMKLKEEVHEYRLKQIHKDFKDYKNMPTATVLKHHKSLRKISGTYSAAEVGGKNGMISDILRNNHGDKHVEHYFSMKKNDLKRLEEETDQLDEISDDKLRDYAGAALQDKKKDRWKTASKVLDRIARNDAKKANDLKYNRTESLSENFRAGPMELDDASVVTISSHDAQLLNRMFDELNHSNREKMLEVAMRDETGFEEILGFAREVL